MSTITGHQSFMVALRSRLRFKELQGNRGCLPVDYHADLDQYLTQLFQEYIRGTPERRAEIRSLFDDEHAVFYLAQFVNNASEAVKLNGETGLRHALVAASIISSHIGAEFVCLLGTIYRAALGGKISEPMQIYREIARISDEVGPGAAGTRIEAFDRSAIFRQIVEAEEWAANRGRKSKK
jgi:hypothetical protein